MKTRTGPARIPPAGFTLIELLAALAIFAVFAVMAYAGLGAVIKSKTNVERALARTAALQKAVYRLESDFEQAQNRPVRDDFGSSRDAFVVTEDGLVEFTRAGWRNPSLQPRSSLERIAYGFHDGKLTRYTWSALDRAEREKPAEAVILEGLRSVEWHFLDAKQSWRNEWPATEGDSAHPLPMAVQAVLDTEDWGEITLLFRVVASARPQEGSDGRPGRQDQNESEEKPPSQQPAPVKQQPGAEPGADAA